MNIEETKRRLLDAHARSTEMIKHISGEDYATIVATLGIVIASTTKSIEMGDGKRGRGRVLADILSAVDIVDKMSDNLSEKS